MTKDSKIVPTMKSIEQVMIEDVYVQATKISRKENQTVGEKHEYYITLYQLQEIIESYYD